MKNKSNSLFIDVQSIYVMTESIRQLRHVLALCEHSNFRRAAEALHITQSALSVSIQRIEDDYGVPLFTRDRNGTTPTEFGRIVARVARETVGALAEARREIELLNSLGSGSVVIGTDPWVAELIVAPALASMLRSHPRLRFRLRTQGWDELQDALLTRKVDVYVGSPFERADSRVTSRSFDLTQPVVLCRHDHPLTRKTSVKVVDLLPYPFLVPKLPSWYLNWLADHFGNSKPSEEFHDMFLQAEDFTVIRRIVRETDAITAIIVKKFPAQLTPKDFAMIDIEDLVDIRSPVIIATLAERPVPMAAAAFIDEIISEIQLL